MNINIRPAVKEDCPRLLELVQELATYERAPNEVTVTLEHFIESGFGEKPVWWAFVAETSPSNSSQAVLLDLSLPIAIGREAESPSEKSEVVGFALYYIRYSTWKGQAMYLEDILITNDWRGKGIGKLLFDRLIEEAKEKNLTASFGKCSIGTSPPLIFTKNTTLR